MSRRADRRTDEARLTQARKQYPDVEVTNDAETALEGSDNDAIVIRSDRTTIRSVGRSSPGSTCCLDRVRSYHHGGRHDRRGRDDWAGAVVAKDVAPGAVVAGVPARVLARG